MIINIDRSGSVNKFRSILDETAGNKNVKGILILACDGNGFTPDSLDDILKGVTVPLFGGIFPEIVFGKEKLSVGTIVAGLTSRVDIKLVQGLSEVTGDFDDLVDDLIPETGSARTMFVLVDGYSRNINNLIDSLFNIIGLNINYIGGSAGSVNPNKLNMTQSPCLFTSQGLIKDSAILALMDMESGIGVSHGWDKKLSGPHRITESEGNAIISIDWKPAFQVYREIVEKHSKEKFTDDNFFDIAKGYPFGIPKLESERIIRDPFRVDENNSLIVATEIPQESFVYILTGDLESLINAAANAYRDGRDAYTGDEAKTILLMDCITRVLYLGDDFSMEIDSIHSGNIPLIGALTLGEIANCGRDYLEFHNKTCVVGVMED